MGPDEAPCTGSRHESNNVKCYVACGEGAILRVDVAKLRWVEDDDGAR